MPPIPEEIRPHLLLKLGASAGSVFATYALAFAAYNEQRKAQTAGPTSDLLDRYVIYPLGREIDPGSAIIDVNE